jgi:hypothetical protein
MKNNPLLKESIGGYRDFTPLREEDKEGMYEEGDSFIQAQKDAVGAPGSSMFSDETDEDYENEAYDQAGEKFRAAVGMLKDANMDDETIHDLFMSILDSYEEQQGEYDAMNQDMMEDENADETHSLDEYLDEAEKQDKEKEEEPKQSKSNTKDNAGRLKGKMDKFKGAKAKEYQPVHSRVYKESSKYDDIVRGFDPTSDKTSIGKKRSMDDIVRGFDPTSDKTSIGKKRSMDDIVRGFDPTSDKKRTF